MLTPLLCQRLNLLFGIEAIVRALCYGVPAGEVNNIGRHRKEIWGYRVNFAQKAKTMSKTSYCLPVPQLWQRWRVLHVIRDVGITNMGGGRIFGRSMGLNACIHAQI